MICIVVAVNLVAHAELAAAILLIIEIVFLQQSVASLVKTALAPVLSPENSGWHGSLCFHSSFVYLFEAFPSGRGECCREVCDAKFLCLDGGGGEADAEAFCASCASLRLCFESFYLREPFFVVVVSVYPAHAKRFGMSFAFSLAYVIFLCRENVGIVVEYHRGDAMLHKPLHYG